MTVEGTALLGRDGEIRVLGDVTITFSGGVRLQVSQMLVRIVPGKDNGEKTIIVEPLPPSAGRKAMGPAVPPVKPAITGEQKASPALADLLRKLVGQGLISPKRPSTPVLTLPS